nr:PAS domain S-box protein [Xinfangfangia pollutisoli]
MDLLSLIPLAAIVLLVALVASLVWAVTRSEADQRRTKLATDALWVEQTLRFQLGVDEDMLVRLALDAASGTPEEVLEARARLHVANNPEVLSVIWHDAQGRPRGAVPGLSAPSDADLVARLQRSGAVSARPVYGAVQEGRVTMAVRAAEGGGVVTETISLPLMFERHIPWWIAEQYGVELVDTGDRQLAERARRDAEPGGAPHQISFDPPLSGTFLRITPYPEGREGGSLLLLASIGALAAFAILALVALYRNTARRRRAEVRLRGEMAFRRSMEESLTVGLRAKDHEGRILYVNSAFCRLVGWPEEALVGQGPPMPYWAPDRLEETLARQRALAAGGAVAQAFETRFRRADGSEIEVQVYEAPLIDARGAHRGWMGSVIDITEAKRAARLARAQDEAVARTGRLVTLGEMASTLAHELNQPLAAIASYAAGARNLIERGETAALGPVVEKLSLQAGRAGQIIRRVQDLARKREPSFTRLALAEVIQGTAGFLAADAREHRVRIALDLAAAPEVEADRILIEQVLVNLIRNGIEAMGPRRSGDEIVLRLRGDATGAVIEVQDAGQGVDPAMAERLYDAFASSKAQGMGMGLNICRSIVELHGGRLEFRPAEGGGTVFSVSLPAAGGTRMAAE